MRILSFIILFHLTFSPLVTTAQDSLVAQRKVTLLMGSRFEFTAVAQDTALAWDAINAGIEEVQRIEKLISSWDANSQTTAINQHAGIQPVKVDEELFQLIFRAKKISNLTNGAFDISYASMDKIWFFDGTMTEMPSEEAIQAAKSKINYQNIILDKEASSIFLREKGMKIGFGAIGKGYAANRALAIMKAQSGVQGVLVNASGDIINWGALPNGEPWRVHIADPMNKGQSMGWIAVDNLAVVTSGDYEKFVFFEGKRYAHIIDPRTGYPTTGIKSVSIVCPDAEIADALATAVFVLGTEAGMSLINQLKGVEGLIITDENKMLTSEHLILSRE